MLQRTQTWNVSFRYPTSLCFFLNIYSIVVFYTTHTENDNVTMQKSSVFNLIFSLRVRTVLCKNHGVPILARTALTRRYAVWVWGMGHAK